MKRNGRINPVSKRRQREQAAYRDKRREFLRDNEHCLACRRIYTASGGQHGCPVPDRATDVHHMKGRVGDRLLDERYWMQVCRTCHRWIEEHPVLSKRYGLSLSRLEVEDAG